jgi:hypothetical protein
MPTWVYLTQGPAERKAYNDELVAWHDGKQRLENAKQALKGHRPLAWDDAHP